ncbi:MAG: MotA/TolQ/ExbB proton channel family protein [Planctomycetes bacterium]|nr:MotA/TolQ/ExbB proton channel family protein [Planctomycetota bacterium]
MRSAIWLTVAVVMCAVVLAMPTSQVWGQEPAAAPPAAAPAAPPAAGAPAAPAPGAAAAPGAPAEAPHKTQSKLVWIIITSGWIGLLLLLLSMYFVATLIQLFIQFRPEVAAPPEIVQECENLLGNKQYQEMYDLLVADDSFFSRILTAGIAELRVGLGEARDAMERQADAQTVDMDKKASILAVLGTLGPMIGLLGTLLGMIRSFSVIAMSGGGSIKAEQVAEGISEALLLTFEGVALAVPAIFFYSFFKNRITSISVNTVLLADKFLGRMGRMNKSKAAPGAAAAV